MAKFQLGASVLRHDSSQRGFIIEVAHIMLELKARRELQNVLIVCPKSLQDKWKMELQEKFAHHWRKFP